MKKNKFAYSLIVSLGLFAFGAVGLSGCSSATGFKAAAVSLDKASLELQVGDTVTLKAKVSKGYSAELRWFSSNENVAYVDGGHVFATGEGTAVITAAYGGGFADCTVVVSGTGGGGDTGDRLLLNPTKMTLEVGKTGNIKYTISPADATVTFSSEKEDIATVDASGMVTAVAVGATVITARGSNDKIATCSITVTEAGQGGGGGGGEELDIAVDKNLGYTGALTIGSPLIQKSFTESLLADFNRLTGSNIAFTVSQFEEDNGTSGYGKADSMPAVFPYASDQTLTLYQFGALSSVNNTDKKWIKENMGADALTAATLTSAVGYPFAADNGVVMFYDKSNIPDISAVDTVTKLLALATEQDKEINYSIGNAFYAAGALMTYAGGHSLYTLTPTNTSYTSSSTFGSAEGVKAAKLIRNIITHGQVRNATAAPVGDVLVTITDVSKVQSFKTRLGANYGVAPLPFVEDGVRLGSFLGYKFLGVNNTLSQSDKTMASAVAKFLCSEYAQAKRFDNFYTRPTLKSLEEYAGNEPHIAALAEQSKNGGTIPLTAISSELWSQAGAAVTSIKALAADAPDSEYKSILDLLDSQLNKTE